MRRPVLSLLIAALIALITSPAAAQDAGGAEPVKQLKKDVVSDAVQVPVEDFFDGAKQDDAAYQALYHLWGAPVATVKAQFFGGSELATGDPYQGQTLLTLMARLLIPIAQVVGAVLLGYIILVGLVKTNQQGVFLGNWDSAMLPLRMTYGFGLNLPMPKFGGLNFAQVATIGAALLGIGMAGAAYSVVLKSYDSVPMSVPHGGDKLRRIADELIRARVCQEFILQSGLDDEYTVKEVSRGGNKTMSLVMVGDNGICGTAGIVSQDNEALRGGGESGWGQAGRGKSYVAELVEDENAMLTQLRRLVGQDILRYLTVTNGALDQVARSIVTNQISEATHDSYMTLVNNIESKITDRVSTYLQRYSKLSNDNRTKSLERLGWVAFGSLYWQINAAQTRFSETFFSAIPEFSDPGEDMNGNVAGWLTDDSVKAEFKTTMSRTQQFLAQHKTLYEGMQSARKLQQGEPDGVFEYFGDLIESFGAKATEATYNVGMWGMQTLTYGGNKDTANAGNYDPMLEMRTMGNTILNAVTAIYAADLFTGGDESDQDEDGGIFKKLFAKAAEAFGAMSIVLIGIGVLLAYGIPLMPYFMWIIAQIGYISYVSQSVLVAPFWSIMHMTPDGGDITGRGGSGYPIIMNLVLRPVLMVTGMILGIGLFRYAGWLVNETLLPTLVMVRDGAVMGPLTPFIGFGLYALIQLSVAFMCFSLIYELPKSALAWLGVNDSMDLGEREGRSSVYGFMMASNRTFSAPLGGMKGMKG